MLDSTAATDAITALTPGFKVAVMQMLLPAQAEMFELRQYPYTTFQPYCVTPMWDFSVQSDTVSGDTWNEFTVQSNTFQTQCSSGYFPSMTAIQTDVFGNGANPYDFFNTTNGWNFTTSKDGCDIFQNCGYSAIFCTDLLVTLSNQTPNTVTLHITQNHGDLIGGTTRTLPGYTAASIGSHEDITHGPDTEVEVDYPDGTEIARFDVQQDHGAGNVTYTPEGPSGSEYQLVNQGTTHPSCTTRAINDQTGLQLVGLYNPSASQ
jgi:hypothetical protein